MPRNKYTAAELFLYARKIAIEEKRPQYTRAKLHRDYLIVLAIGTAIVIIYLINK
jgi:hypothetical protein